MRKSIIMGLGLALSLAGAASAQSGRGGRGDRRERPDSGTWEDRGRGEGRGTFGGPQGLLLKDIKLSEAQKTQLKQLRASQRPTDAQREQMKQQMADARAARQRGDTAAVRVIFQRNQAEMQQRRAQEIAAIRNILTIDQRVQFDKNVAALQQREAKHGQRVGQKGKGGKQAKGLGKRGFGRGGRDA